MNTLRIIKINFLSLLALPFLLLGVICKMLAKAFEKIKIMGGVIILIYALDLVVYFIKGSSDQEYPMVFIILIGIIVISIMLDYAFSIVPFFTVVLTRLTGTVARAGVGFIISIGRLIIQTLNKVYTIFYSVYTSLSRCCYETSLTTTIPKHIKIFACPFYILLKALNKGILLFLKYSIFISLAASVFLLFYYFNYEINLTYSKSALSLMSYLQNSGYYEVMNFIAELAMVGGLCVIFICLGIEWNEWGRELQFSENEYLSYIKSYQEAYSDIQNKSFVASDESNAEYAKYLNIIFHHIKTLDTFLQKVHPVISKCDDYLLLSTYKQYTSDVDSLIQTISTYNNQIPPEIFDEMVPLIKRLDVNKQKIEELTEKILATEQATSTASFFSGCTSMEKLEKRYKALCKVYHPDSGNGDEETFKCMCGEYEKMKKLVQ